MNTATSTFLDLLAVALVFFLLALPSLVGHLNDRRIDRQLARAEKGLPAVRVRAGAGGQRAAGVVQRSVVAQRAGAL
ncbi:hypothetical protein ACH4SP_38750 [Streptomyces sp. NPDC021093]|uniref:hypothetical protein n=1 Tax=Streptomyces sp. NPDC021093 TaxID=3365112 RepID=UPI0037968A22